MRELAEPSLAPPQALGRLIVPVRIVIRRVRREDLTALEWFGLFTHHREVIRETFARHEAGEVRMIVASARNEAVGQVWVDLTSKAERRVGVLWALRVFPFFQGHGLGRRLVRAAEDEMRAASLRVSELSVERENVAARRLYNRLGYRVVGEERGVFSYRQPDGRLRRERVDEWVLHRRLGRREMSPALHG